MISPGPGHVAQSPPGDLRKLFQSLLTVSTTLDSLLEKRDFALQAERLKKASEQLDLDRPSLMDESKALLKHVKEALQNEIAFSHGRKKDFDSAAQGPGPDESQSKRRVERIVVMLSEEFRQFSAYIEDSKTRELYPNGELYQFIHAQSEQIAEEHLEYEDEIKITVITVNSTYKTETYQKAASFLKQYLTNEDRVLTQAIELARHTAAEELKGICNFEGLLDLSLFDSSRLDRMIDVRFRLQVKLRGEIPRPTLGQIASSTIRTPLGIISPFMSVLGFFIIAFPYNYLLLIRCLLGAFFLVPCLLLLPFVVRRRLLDQREKVKRSELERFQSALSADLSNLFQKILDERKTQLNDYSLRTLDSLRRQIDSKYTEYARSREAERAVIKRETMAEIAKLDKRLRELEASLQQCTGIDRDFNLAGRPLENPDQSRHH